MKKTSAFATYLFYLQLLLIFASVVTLLTVHGINRLNVLLTGVPAIVLAPIILIISLIVLIKRHKVSLVIWSSICFNAAAGMFFLFLVFFGRHYNL